MVDTLYPIYRHEVLEDFKQTLVRELKLLEEEVVNIKQAESKVLVSDSCQVK